MSQLTYFTFSVEKGIRGNIGKDPVLKTKNGNSYINVMLFLSSNGKEIENPAIQIVNVYFTQEAKEILSEFNQGDYVQIGFDRIDLSKGVSEQTGEEVFYISVKANSIKMLHKAVKKEMPTVISIPSKAAEKMHKQAKA